MCNSPSVCWFLIWSVFGWHCWGRASPRQLLGPSTQSATPPWTSPTARTGTACGSQVRSLPPLHYPGTQSAHHTPHPGCKEDVLQRMRPQQAPEAWPKPGRSPSDPGWTLGFLKADTLRPLPAQAANQRRRVGSAARRGRRGWLVLSPEGRFIAFHHSSRCGRCGSFVLLTNWG